MKKIPTLFERDWNGDRSRVTDLIHAGCEWVLAGEGIATRKVDGTCCMVRDGKLYKRRELKSTDNAPEGFELVDKDTETGKIIGWLPIGAGPEDRYHREAWTAASILLNGTYELIGPKIQGNPEHANGHLLVKHGYGIAGEVKDVPRTFEKLREWFTGQDIEGLVFYHPDGRKAKIKLKDFGLKRNEKVFS